MIKNFWYVTWYDTGDWVTALIYVIRTVDNAKTAYFVGNEVSADEVSSDKLESDIINRENKYWTAIV